MLTTQEYMPPREVLSAGNTSELARVVALVWLSSLMMKPDSEMLLLLFHFQQSGGGQGLCTTTSTLQSIVLFSSCGHPPTGDTLINGEGNAEQKKTGSY